MLLIVPRGVIPSGHFFLAFKMSHQRASVAEVAKEDDGDCKET